MSITITGRQREMLYAVLVDRLPGIDDVWLAVQSKEWSKAQQLGREFSDLLRLLVDDLGWGEGREEPVELTTPPDVLQRAIQILKRDALVEDHEQRQNRLKVAEVEIEREDTVEACDGILEQLAGDGANQ